MTDGIQRRLAAILAADVAGYSRLMGEDEAGTLNALRHLRTELFAPTVDYHRGTVVKSMGDGWLVEFGSVVDAVTCAIEIQEGLAAHDRIKLRVGVHLGDISHEEEDIYGDGVNIAARLQEIAQPGGIVISDMARRSIRGKLGAAFVDLGAHTLKNIAEPITAYGWGMTTIVADATALPLPDKPSIAVLPFTNMSGDPEQEYFADGIAEDVITALSRFRSLFVISRNSSFTYRGTSPDIRTVAKEMGVRYVVEGSVRRARDRVRITSQLIDATTGNHLWADRFDGTLDDVFDLQDQITEQIVVAVVPEIEAHERERAKRKPPDSLDAWERYQRGLWHLWRYVKDDALKAEALFRSAVELDHDFAPGFTGLSLVLYNQVLFGWTDAADQSLDEAFEAGRRAVLLDDKDSLAHFALGRVYSMQGKFEAAISELEKAVNRNPSSALAHWGLGVALAWSARPREAIKHGRTAIRQSPHDPALWVFENLTGFAHIQLGEYDEAMKWLTKAAQHPNSSFYTHLNRAVVCVEQDRLDEARAAIDEASRLEPNLSVTTVAAMLRHMYPEVKNRFLHAWRKAGLPE